MQKKQGILANKVMDDKALFQNIQTKLEHYLYEYRNSYPKNVWQILSVDIPLITLIVSAFVIIELIGVGIFSITLIIALTLPYIYLRSSDSSGVWQKLIDKRKNHEEYNQQIVNRINDVATYNLQKYPDVKNYLTNYHLEVAAETERKKEVQIKYNIIMTLGIVALTIFAIYTFKYDTRLWFLKEKSDTTLADIELGLSTPTAIVKPLNSDTAGLKTFYVESSRPYLRIPTPAIAPTGSEDSCIVRVIITDTTGRAANGLPYFDFTYYFRKENPKYITSYPIVFDIENHPYEIARRVKYLEENAKDLRYTIEKL